MLNKTLSVVIFLFLIQTIHGQQSNIDSLRHEAEILKDSVKLEAIYELIKACNGTPDMLPYTNWLEREAKAQNNLEKQGLALMLKMTYYSDNLISDSLMYWGVKAKEFTLRHKQYDRYFLAENYIIQDYIAKGSYQLALAQITEMLAQAKEMNDVNGLMNAYESMGATYIESGQPTQAIAPLKEGLELLENKAPERAIARMDYMRLLISATNAANDPAASLVWCKELWLRIEVFEKEKQQPGNRYAGLDMSDYMLDCHRMEALNYIALDDAPHAKVALDAAEAYRSDQIFEHYVRYLDQTWAYYYNFTGDYKLAGQYASTAAGFFRNKEMQSDYIETGHIWATALAGQGDYRQAYQLSEAMVSASDSLAAKKLAQQISEIHTLYRVDQLTAEKNRVRIQNLWLLSVCLLLVAGVFGAIIYSRRLTAKNRGLIRQIREQDRLQEQLSLREEELLALRRSKPDENAKTETADMGDVLFASLKEWMASEKPYTDPELTRRTVAKHLNTNETYLHETIKKHTGHTFSEYLNGLRLAHAREMLSDQSKKQTIETVATDSGFGSRHTFHRQFRQQYNLTPEEFRRWIVI